MRIYRETVCKMCEGQGFCGWCEDKGYRLDEVAPMQDWVLCTETKDIELKHDEEDCRGRHYHVYIGGRKDET